ncbi:MAG: cadC 5 [Acidobacteria bacterium]|nr:cadC 5 [Acidobacteriota bacterium]
MVRPVRFRFDDFVLAPRQRVLWRNGTPVPLISKYFDLLVLLVERQHDEPKFIRTVSRHGYQFVYAGVVEEADDRRDGNVQQPGTKLGRLS